MFDALVARQPALLIPILSVIGASLVFLVWILAHYWAKIRRMELDSALKKDLLNRGLNTAEVERVLLASSEANPAALLPEKEAISEYEYHLVEKMLESEYPVDDIERLVRAFKSGENNLVRLPDRLLS